MQPLVKRKYKNQCKMVTTVFLMGLFANSFWRFGKMDIYFCPFSGSGAISFLRLSMKFYRKNIKNCVSNKIVAII
jgi:hypothetical protein